MQPSDFRSHYTLLVKQPAARAVTNATLRGLRVDSYTVHSFYEQQTLLTVHGKLEIIARWFGEDLGAIEAGFGYPEGSLLHFSERNGAPCDCERCEVAAAPASV